MIDGSDDFPGPLGGGGGGGWWWVWEVLAKETGSQPVLSSFKRT